MADDRAEVAVNTMARRAMWLACTSLDMMPDPTDHSHAPKWLDRVRARLHEEAERVNPSEEEYEAAVEYIREHTPDVDRA